MKISLIHPSHGRPQQAFETAKKWIGKSDACFQYILMCDYDDPLLTDYETWFYEQSMPTVWADNNHSAIEAINNAAKIATGDLLVVISDDFDCPEHWDTLLLQVCKNYRSSRYSKDFLLKTQDGIQKTLVTLPIMDRKYYERFGYVYHPEYKHMGCDVELTAVALMTGKLIYSDLLFPHNHYSTGKTPKDAINDKNDLTYQHGDEVLARHKVNNFGIENPVMAYSQIVWH